MLYEANRKRSEAADARRGEGGKLEAKPVVEHSVPVLDTKEQKYLNWKLNDEAHKSRQAKASRSKTNRGTLTSPP